MHGQGEDLFRSQLGLGKMIFVSKHIDIETLFVNGNWVINFRSDPMLV